jgi:hypothetical protein
MILRDLYVMIEDVPEVAYPFLKRSRHVCNYVEREVLRKGRYTGDRFNRIVVVLCPDPRDEAFVNTANAAVVQIPFDTAAYSGKSGAELSLYYVDRLREGVEKCARTLDVPKTEIFEGLARFVAGGLKNEWVHKDRHFKKLGLRALLRCFLDQAHFRLQLEVSREGIVVFKSFILETDPDEVAFEHRFKDVIVEGRRLVVTSRNQGPLWQTPIAEL